MNTSFKKIMKNFIQKKCITVQRHLQEKTLLSNMNLQIAIQNTLIIHGFRPKENKQTNRLLVRNICIKMRTEIQINIAQSLNFHVIN
jgi:hypothetical protein